MRRITLLLPAFCVLFLLIHTPQIQGTTYVVKPDGSGDHVTIQDAMDAATTGDTIHLDDGTFTGTGNKDLDPGGKNLVIEPVAGASPIIDCEGAGRAFHIHSGEDASTIVRGLGLTGGVAPGGTTSKGGAFLIENASPTVVENVIYENQACYGAGIYLDNSNSLILRNQITDNEHTANGGSWGFGSGIFVGNSTASIYDNRFNSTVFDWVEAIYVIGGTVSIENNDITGYGWVDGLSNIIADSSDVTLAGNRFKESGGCVRLNYCTGTVRANHFLDSYSMVADGGVTSFNSAVDIEYNYFDHVRDGAVDWHGSTGTIKRNVINGTPVRPLDSGARAIDLNGTPPEITNNTFYENGIIEGATSGADIHVNGGDGMVANGCIFVNSTAVDLAIMCGSALRASSASPRTQYTANWHWGNPIEDILLFCTINLSVRVSPVLCDPDNDNFFFTGELPNDTTLMGALPPGYSNFDVLLTTVPPEQWFGTSTATESVVLSGFSFKNRSNFPAPVNYRLYVEGPGQLDDNGDPASLAGSTPVLEAGQTWDPPEAKLMLDDPQSPGLVTIKYVTAYAPALAIPETTRTNVAIFNDATAITPPSGAFEYALEQNIPNPANPRTTIAFSLAVASEVTLTIYDVQGRLVKTLVRRIYTEGRHTVDWDGTDAQRQPAASGVYLYRLDAGGFVKTKKLVLLK